MRHYRILAAALAVAVILPAAAGAQAMASEHGMVQQRVDGTTITIQYYRPQRRGRTHLIGGVVRWGRMWTPGANWATTIEVSRDVRMEGHTLPKGKYSIWMIPQPSQWTVILSSAWKRFHVQGPDSTARAVRFTVTPQTAPMLDVLTFTFPAIERDATTLLLRWGTTAVPLHIAVTPSNAVAPTPQEP
ncbi:MAG TPA: DUF2911 domain-containing protein [Gemmatimonadaceae bacterium]|nr:DUF2911 domain-containing protein [Gemmatimonadaceae bacterium]